MQKSTHPKISIICSTKWQICRFLWATWRKGKWQYLDWFPIGAKLFFKCWGGSLYIWWSCLIQSIFFYGTTSFQPVNQKGQGFCWMSLGGHFDYCEILDIKRNINWTQHCWRNLLCLGSSNKCTDMSSRLKSINCLQCGMTRSNWLVCVVEGHSTSLSLLMIFFLQVQQ